MAAQTPTPEQIVRGILILLQNLIREKAHGRVTITVRDGKIALTDVQRTYLPENLPGA
jgi:hypothetical protein